MGDAAPASDACYNCAAPLAGADCAVCGQKALPLNPRLHDFLHDFTHEMLHVDGKMFLLVPLFAWLVHRGYRRTGRNYPQHLYFALHVRAAWFAAGTIAAAAALVSWPFFPQAVAALALAYAGIYVVLSFRAAYGGTKRQAFARAVVVVGLYWIAVILATVAMALPVIFWRML